MLNQPAAQAAFSTDIDDTLGCENPAAGNTGHQPHSPFDHACIAHSHSHQHHAQQPLSHATAPQLKFDIDIDDSDDDEIQPLGGTAQLEDRKASHQYASTSTAAPATAGTRAHADAQPDSAQLQSAPQLWASAQSAPQLWASAQSAIAPHLGFQAASTARSAGLQQPPVAKRLTSFKPPRRVMPAAPAKSAGIEAHGSDNGTSVKPAAAAAANGHEAGMEAEREGGGTAALTAQPLKRLRKAGQATPAPPQPPLKLKGGPDDGKVAKLLRTHCNPPPAVTHTACTRWHSLWFSFAFISTEMRLDHQKVTRSQHPPVSQNAANTGRISSSYLTS